MITDAPCYVCGKPSTKLCDFIVDMEIEELPTCDRPMCDEHVGYSTTTFCSVEDQPCEVDSLDFCQPCYKVSAMYRKPTIVEQYRESRQAQRRRLVVLTGGRR